MPGRIEGQFPKTLAVGGDARMFRSATRTSTRLLRWACREVSSHEWTYLAERARSIVGALR